VDYRWPIFFTCVVLLLCGFLAGVGLAVPGTNWDQLVPDLIVGILTAGGIGGLIAASQRSIVRRREQQLAAYAWATLRPHVVERMLQNDYLPADRTNLESESCEVAALVKEADVERIRQLAATLNRPELTLLLRFIEDHTNRQFHAKRVERWIESSKRDWSPGDTSRQHKSMEAVRLWAAGRTSEEVDAYLRDVVYGQTVPSDEQVARMRAGIDAAEADGYISDQVRRWRLADAAARIDYAELQRELDPFKGLHDND
jgi:hypothetical protein